MSDTKKLFMWLALFLIMTIGVFAVKPSAQSIVPGSNADPLVSKSYVDSKINQVIAMIAQQQPVNTAGGDIDVEALKREIISELIYNSYAAFTPVKMTKGQIIIGGEGAEIILRSGSAAGHCAGLNGLVDATTGYEVYNGSEIQINHLILVPRDDGRGVEVTSDEAWFIVKGRYRTLN